MVSAYEGIKTLTDVCLLLLKIVYCILESTYRLFVTAEEKNVAGEIVLITGAGHGIGRELALKYASLGATVVCWDVNPQGNQETAGKIKELGGTTAHVYQCDVTDRDEVFRVAQKVNSEVGHPTILINNAGIMPCQKFLDHRPDTVRQIFDVNVLAHVWMLQAFLPNMLETNHGHVVALSSIAGMFGLQNLVPYCASKFAVRGLMEALSDEYSHIYGARNKVNVKFTTVYPYMVDTGLCKKPRIRFPSIMSMVTPQQAAEQIITAQRRNYSEMTIPKYWLSFNSTLRNFPDKTWYIIRDFLDSGVDVPN